MRTRLISITWAYSSWREAAIVIGATIAVVWLLSVAAHARTTGYPLTLDFWLQNTVLRKATIYQCQRRGPGDQLVYIYCGIAARAELITLKAQIDAQQRQQRMWRP